MKIKNRFFFQILFLLGNTVLFQLNSIAQKSNAKDSAAIDKLRTESGVDPTRVQTRVGYTFLVQDQKASAATITNRANLNLGVNRWSIKMTYDIVTRSFGKPGEGFKSGMGDIRLSFLNAFFVKGKHAMAASAEFQMPSGGTDFGFGYFSVSPSFTYSYTINPGLFFATQPQFTMHLMKDPVFPPLQILTIRSFLAKFTKTGMFFVFEPRPVFDLGNKRTDFVISPIIGKSLGGGFNLVFLGEIALTNNMQNTRGQVYQFGFNKNF